MPRTIYARYDGKVILPEEDLEFAPNARLRLVVEYATEPDYSDYPLLRTLRSARLDGPADFSERIHDYLYGTPKNEP
jgi:hypothetical protein